MLDVGQPTLGGIAALFASRGFGASLSDRFERGTRGLVGFREIGLGRRQMVGGCPARGGGALDFADEALACFGEFLRRVLEFAALGLRLGAALADGDDLRRGAFIALAPRSSLVGDRL